MIESIKSMYSEPSFPLSLSLPPSPPIYYAYYLMIIFPSEHHVVGDLGTVLEFAALKPKTSTPTPWLPRIRFTRISMT